MSPCFTGITDGVVASLRNRQLATHDFILGKVILLEKCHDEFHAGPDLRIVTYEGDIQRFPMIGLDGRWNH
jgi:hypothetical protein